MSKFDSTKIMKRPMLHNILPYALERCYVAGGAITSHITKTDINDYDIYPKDTVSRDDILRNLFELGTLISYTERAATFVLPEPPNHKFGDPRPIYQVMIIDDNYSSAADIFERFDFTVCMGAYDCDSKELVFHEDFLVDIASRTLRFNPKTLYPLASMMRTLKYRAKGYSLPKSTLLQIVFRITFDGMPQTWEDIESALGGYYGHQLVLDAGDMEINFENIMEVLEGFHDKDFRSVKLSEINELPNDIETVITMLDKSPRIYFPTGATLMSMKPDYTDIKYHSDDTLTEFAEQYWTLIEENLVLKSYKCFEVVDGELRNVSYSAQRTVYRIGELTKKNIAPYFFVGKTISDAGGYANSNKKTYVVHEVYFKLKDIEQFNSNSIQVSRFVISANEIKDFEQVAGELSVVRHEADVLNDSVVVPEGVVMNIATEDLL